MSSSSRREKATDFDRWLADKYAETQGFTALILLIALEDTAVVPVSCSYLHVIGDEVSWRELRALIDGSGRSWDGIALFAESAPGGGPLIELVAKARLQERVTEVTGDRMCLNAAGFFDKKGRAIRIDPIAATPPKTWN